MDYDEQHQRALTAQRSMYLNLYWEGQRALVETFQELARLAAAIQEHRPGAADNDGRWAAYRRLVQRQEDLWVQVRATKAQQRRWLRGLRDACELTGSELDRALAILDWYDVRFYPEAALVWLLQVEHQSMPAALRAVGLADASPDEVATARATGARIILALASPRYFQRLMARAPAIHKTSIQE